MNAHDDAIDIAIIGSGFAGLCMAIKLKEAGVTDFLIAEQADTPKVWAGRGILLAIFLPFKNLWRVTGY